MEPRIQYAKTSDGVSIAYCTIGEGDPLVIMPHGPFSHIQLEWQIPECRYWYTRLAARRRLVCYDPRGSGLSDRRVSAYAIDALIEDLKAVVERAGLERFALFGSIDVGAAAIAYAARNPERVSHLILWCAYTNGTDLLNAPETQGWLALMDKDWSLVTHSWAHNMVGWSESGLADRLAALWRESCAPEALPACWNGTLEYDVEDDLAQVRAPTLVLHRRQVRWLTVDSARRLAASIPDARLTLLEGAASLPFAGDVEAAASAIEDFLNGDRARQGSTSVHPGAVPIPGREVTSGMTAILFADIVDSTALTERLGDTAFRAKARDLDAALRTIIRDHSGTPIEGKLLGDGVLAVFTSARQAIEAALACGRAGDEGGLPLHLGLHAGDVIREDNNVYGGAVNIASRISGLSAPSEVLVSDTVRSLARTSAGVHFEDRGEESLKGVADPVRLWAVREAGTVGRANP
jgi:class 3 adenylate cyclase/pimeloyl-ACP methyl ester carboxylesterase